MRNNTIKGPTDLYAQLVEVMVGTRGCVTFSKKQAKDLDIKWSFVESSAQVLGLNINKAGAHGFNISKV